MTFPDRLRQLRTESGLNKTQLAARTGINFYTVCAYERGERLPSVLPLCDLADYFHVTTDYLLGRTNRRDVN